jgi:hypothetical protein
MSAWWAGLPPAQATVDCGGREHRLRWEGGELRALDHGEPESERTLTALGGQPCACIELLDAWERHRDDVRVLALASRGPADPLVIQHDAGGQLVGGRPPALGAGRPGNAGGWWSSGRASLTVVGLSQTIVQRSGPTAFATGGRASRAAQAQNELVSLLGLGGGLPERLVASVMAAWRERLAHRQRSVAGVRPQLQAALYGRALAAAAAWLGAARLEMDVEMVGEGREPSLSGENGMVLARLPFGWLIDVWAKGLATIFGCFCLSAESGDGRTWHLTAVGPDIGPARIITVELPTVYRR